MQKGFTLIELLVVVLNYRDLVFGGVASISKIGG